METKVINTAPQAQLMSGALRRQHQAVMVEQEKQIIRKMVSARGKALVEHLQLVQRAQKRSIIQALITARKEAPEEQQ